jgi:hypothetical protein
MANRFWVGGTGTWDGSNTTNWSTTTGGAGGAAVPGSADAAIFDGSSGGGTVTVAASIGGTNTIQSLTAGAFTGTLDFSVNNPSITFNSTSTAVNLGGTGARKFLLGSGTWTLSGAGAAVFEFGTTTNLDPTSDTTAPIVFSANTTSERQFNGGGRTFGTLTIAANTSRGGVRIFSANTFSSITVAAGTGYLTFPASTTNTISGSAGLVLNGSSTNPMLVQSSSSAAATISLSSGTSIPTWAAFMNITTTGSGAMTATDSFDLGRNTLDSGDTITAPSVGGGGARVIGG